MGRSKKLLALGIVCSLLLGGCGNNTQTSTDSSPEPKAATEAASRAANGVVMITTKSGKSGNRREGDPQGCMVGNNDQGSALLSD